ncbi:MAG: AMP-binding protein [Synergistaceae bacterium]|nr:AMP-binding protein [Synergistaceae bacterium]
MKRFLTKLIIRFFFRVKIKGIENWKNMGDGVLIAPNYVSFIDPLLLALFLPEPVPFAVERRLAQKRYVKYFLPLAETHILDADSPITLKYFFNLLKNGGRCVIFPELQPTTTGNPMKVSAGVAAIALHTGARVLPIHIEGTERTHFSRLTHKKWPRLFTHVEITILPVQDLRLQLDGNDIDEQQRKSRIKYAKAGRALERIMDNAALVARRRHKPTWDVLLDSRATYGGKTELYCDVGSEPITYNGFITRVLLFEYLIKKVKIKEQYVGVLLPTSVAGAVTIFALQKMKKVPAMLNFSQGVKQLKNCLKIGGIKTVITSRKFVTIGKLEHLTNAAEEAGCKIVYLENEAHLITAWQKLCKALKTYFVSARKASTKLLQETENPAYLLFTSGSEGLPKGVVLSYKNINTNAYQTVTRVDFYRTDRALCVLPIFHSFGLCGIYFPMVLGFMAYFYPTPLQYKTIASLCYDERITILFATDTFLAGYGKAASDNYDFATMRIVVQGGEKTKASTQNLWMERFNIRITEGYGVTECSPIVAHNYYAHHKTGTVGPIVEGLEYRLEPIEGVAEGGRLWLKGDSIMKGYMRATAPGVIEPLKDGWYDTGDIVKIDDLGYVTVLGRAKRFAKLGGEMVSLPSIEEALQTIYPDKVFAVVAQTIGEKEVIVAVTTDSNLKCQEVKNALSEIGMAEIAIPKKLVYMTELPLLGNGKTDYPSLMEKL